MSEHHSYSGIEETYEAIDVNQTVKLIENQGIISTNKDLDSFDFTKAFNLRPTLAGDKLTIQISEHWNAVSTLKMINMQGHILYEIPLLPFESEKIIDVSNLPNGVYFMGGQLGSAQMAKKFVRQH